MSNSRCRALLITLGVLLATVLATGSVADAQIDVARGKTGQVLLAKQADCRVSPNGLTARDASFTVLSPERTPGANIRTRAIRLINGRAVPLAGASWSGWQQLLPSKPVQFRGASVWTGDRRARLELAHVVEFWGLRGGFLGAKLAIQNRYLTTSSSLPDLGSLGPWLPVQRFCQVPRR
ncbi:hypothetical protein GTV32_13570 [Gordonia sp. SID5947]|uniref:hypothetical protein n=1 Tax=Gordonia sp. SID5947 TaxID=2690315 RepID=UPI00136FDB30|nr:hypothetical protein [Gordonia sp. SID5947]MYR07273.1 hypothetical protein [Gordonia sp. SID5947]